MEATGAWRALYRRKQRNLQRVVLELEREIQVFSRSEKESMKKKRTGYEENREVRYRIRRLVCGLAMAVLLAGCADGRETGDGARGADDIMVPIGESDGEAVGEPDGGLGETSHRESAENSPEGLDGNLTERVDQEERNPGAEAGGGAPGSSGETTTGNGSGGNGDGLTATVSGESNGRPGGTADGESIGGLPGDTGQERAEPTGEPEITLVMVGDILLHTPVAESGLREDGSYDFSAVFAQMKEEIQAADLALVNQEVILGGAQLGVSGYPAFNAPYELGDALVDAGFDVILHATNHALDKGKKGIQNCLSFWQENYPDTAVLGIHDSQEAQEEIYVYEKQGIRIAILNYTYGTNGIPLPGDMPYAVDLLDRERVADDLRRAGELADFVVVCPHWGTEYTLSATREQEDWAALFAENGADLILGTHPHVIEPVGWVNGGTAPDGESGQEAIAPGGTLVYYSLGNFVNWTSGTGAGVANRMVGGMARVTIGLDDAGEAVIKAYDVEPLVCHVEQGFGGVTVYPLEEYTENKAEQNEIVKQDSSFSLEYCRQLVRDVFGQNQ